MPLSAAGPHGNQRENPRGLRGITYFETKASYQNPVDHMQWPANITPHGAGNKIVHIRHVRAIASIHVPCTFYM